MSQTRFKGAQMGPKWGPNGEHSSGFPARLHLVGAAPELGICFHKISSPAAQNNNNN